MYWETYDNLLAETQALCGCFFTDIELPRIHAFFNRRLRKAYDASNYWQRFLIVGDEKPVYNNSIQRADPRSVENGDYPVIEILLKVYASNPLARIPAQEIPWIPTSASSYLLLIENFVETVFCTYKNALDQSARKIQPGENFIPNEWTPYIAQGTYADFLRAEGQQEKAAMAEAEAESILTDRMIDYCTYGAVPGISCRFSGHGSQQFRS
jgi:hypothetical protein